MPRRESRWSGRSWWSVLRPLPLPARPFATCRPTPSTVRDRECVCECVCVRVRVRVCVSVWERACVRESVSESDNPLQHVVQRLQPSRGIIDLRIRSVPRWARIEFAQTFVSLNSRIRGLLGPVPSTTERFT